MGKQSRQKRARRLAPPPPPVGRQGSAWRARRWWLALAAALALAGAAAGLAVALSSGSSSAATISYGPASDSVLNLPNLESGPPPWPAEHAHLPARLNALGFPRLQMEANVLHTHEHIDLYINGQHVTVPALIGIDVPQNFLDPVHTHDPSGIIHIESPVNIDYMLGQFFDVWGLRFTPKCIGGLCAGNGKKLRVYVNGTAVRGDPRRVVLQAHQEIVVAYGTPAELPTPIPARYRFPTGL